VSLIWVKYFDLGTKAKKAVNFIIIFVELTQIFEHKFYVRICLADGLHIGIVGMHIVQAVSGDLAIGSFWFVPRQLDG
jgi:hypothetical protein